MIPVSYPKNPNTPTSHLPFSPCVRAGNLLFVSGQASVDETGKIVKDTFEGEFHRSMSNLEKILETAGASLSNVIQTRCYVDDAADLPEFNRLYAGAFSSPFPARTTITNCFGGVIKFEIDCIAVVEDGTDS